MANAMSVINGLWINKSNMQEQQIVQKDEKLIFSDDQLAEVIKLMSYASEPAEVKQVQTDLVPVKTATNQFF